MLGTWSLPTDHCGLWAPTLNKIALWTTDSKPGHPPLLLSSPLSHTWLPRLWLGLMLSRITTYIMGPQLLATANGRIYQMVESLSWGIGNLMNHLASGHLPKLRWLRSLGRGKSVLRPETEGDSDWGSCLLMPPNRPLPSGWILFVWRTRPTDCSWPKGVPLTKQVHPKQMREGRAGWAERVWGRSIFSF